jgi:hypothetical protein
MAPTTRSPCWDSVCVDPDTHPNPTLQVTSGLECLTGPASRTPTPWDPRRPVSCAPARPPTQRRSQRLQHPAGQRAVPAVPHGQPVDLLSADLARATRPGCPRTVVPAGEAQSVTGTLVATPSGVVMFQVASAPRRTGRHGQCRRPRIRSAARGLAGCPCEFADSRVGNNSSRHPGRHHRRTRPRALSQGRVHCGRPRNRLGLRRSRADADEGACRHSARNGGDGPQHLASAPALTHRVLLGRSAAGIGASQGVTYRSSRPSLLALAS